MAWYGIYYIITILISTTYFHNLPTQTINIYHSNQISYTHLRNPSVVSSRSERITLTLAHFPLSLFHFAASDLPPPPISDPSSTRPSPTLDGTDLIGRVFNDPDLGLCRVVEVGPPHRLAPGEGNLDSTGPQLQAGWVPT